MWPAVNVVIGMARWEEEAIRLDISIRKGIPLDEVGHEDVVRIALAPFGIDDYHLWEFE